VGLQPTIQGRSVANPARWAGLTNCGPLARSLPMHASDPVRRPGPTRANGPAFVSQGQRPWSNHLIITTRAVGPPPLPVDRIPAQRRGRGGPTAHSRGESRGGITSHPCRHYDLDEWAPGLRAPARPPPVERGFGEQPGARRGPAADGMVVSPLRSGRSASPPPESGDQPPSAPTGWRRLGIFIHAASAPLGRIVARCVVPGAARIRAW
jgi:hypothetical protein